jgi:hypothetical protein
MGQGLDVPSCRYFEVISGATCCAVLIECACDALSFDI